VECFSERLGNVHKAPILLQIYAPAAAEPSNSDGHAIPVLAVIGAEIATPLPVALSGCQLEGGRKEDHHTELYEEWDRRGSTPTASPGWIAGSDAGTGQWRET
jgi:hypothetical protein